MHLKSMLRAAATPAIVAAVAAASPAQAAVIYSVIGTTQGGPTFNRPLANGNNAPTSLSGVGTAVTYNTFLFAPSASGMFDFLLTSNIANFDTYLVLYAGGFNPASPLTNVVVANDDFNGSLLQSGFTRALAAGTTYTAVITGYDNADFGNYTLTISNAVGAVPEPATWGMLLLGFGMVGAGLRYRRRSTAVRFA